MENSKNDKTFYVWIKSPVDYYKKPEIKILLHAWKDLFGYWVAVFYDKIAHEAANRKGYLRVNDSTPYTIQTLAMQLDEDPKLAKRSEKYLVDNHFIEWIKDGPHKGDLFVPGLEEEIGAQSRHAKEMQDWRKHKDEESSHDSKDGDHKTITQSSHDNHKCDEGVSSPLPTPSLDTRHKTGDGSRNPSFSSKAENSVTPSCVVGETPLPESESDGHGSASAPNGSGDVKPIGESEKTRLSKAAFDFFSAYPKKTESWKIRKWFNEHRPDDQEVNSILDGVERWKNWEIWKQGPVFIANPSRWLNEQRWMDKEAPFVPVDKNVGRNGPSKGQTGSPKRKAGASTEPEPERKFGPNKNHTETEERDLFDICDGVFNDERRRTGEFPSDEEAINLLAKKYNADPVKAANLISEYHCIDQYLAKKWREENEKTAIEMNALMSQHEHSKNVSKEGDQSAK